MPKTYHAITASWSVIEEAYITTLHGKEAPVNGVTRHPTKSALVANCVAAKCVCIPRMFATYVIYPIPKMANREAE